jgi:hypothetical protein
MYIYIYIYILERNRVVFYAGKKGKTGAIVLIGRTQSYCTDKNYVNCKYGPYAIINKHAFTHSCQRVFDTELLYYTCA